MTVDPADGNPTLQQHPKEVMVCAKWPTLVSPTVLGSGAGDLPLTYPWTPLTCK